MPYSQTEIILISNLKYQIEKNNVGHKDPDNITNYRKPDLDHNIGRLVNFRMTEGAFNTRHHHSHSSLD